MAPHEVGATSGAGSGEQRRDPRLDDPARRRHPPPSAAAAQHRRRGGAGVSRAATLAIYFLRRIAPVVSLSVVYLPAVLLVATYWGMALGPLTSLLSAASFNFFHIPPTGGFTIVDGRNWVALAAFMIVAVVSSTIAEGRGRALRRPRAGRARPIWRPRWPTSSCSARTPRGGPGQRRPSGGRGAGARLSGDRARRGGAGRGAPRCRCAASRERRWRPCWFPPTCPPTPSSACARRWSRQLRAGPEGNRLPGESSIQAGHSSSALSFGLTHKRFHIGRHGNVQNPRGGIGCRNHFV